MEDINAKNHKILYRGKIYRDKLKYFKNTCKSRRFHFWQKNFNEIENALSDPKEFWNKWKTKKYSPKPKPELTGENCFNHFSPLHTEKLENMSTNTYTEDKTPCDILDGSFTKTEMMNIINNLKSKKAQSYDSITNEMIKNASSDILDILIDFINLCLDKSLVPESFCKEIIIPIFKDGSKNDPNNYRWICISSVLQKL